MQLIPWPIWVFPHAVQSGILTTNNRSLCHYLFQQFIVLHVFLSSLVSILSLCLKSSRSPRHWRQLINQSDQSLHNAAKNTKVRGKPGSKSRCCIRAQTHSHRKTAKPEMYRFLWALKSFMCKWSNIFGCSLASAPCSLDEYFLTSRTASLKNTKQ